MRLKWSSMLNLQPLFLNDRCRPKYWKHRVCNWCSLRFHTSASKTGAEMLGVNAFTGNMQVEYSIHMHVLLLNLKFIYHFSLMCLTLESKQKIIHQTAQVSPWLNISMKIPPPHPQPRKKRLPGSHTNTVNLLTFYVRVKILINVPWWFQSMKSAGCKKSNWTRMKQNPFHDLYCFISNNGKNTSLQNIYIPKRIYTVQDNTKNCVIYMYTKSSVQIFVCTC